MSFAATDAASVITAENVRKTKPPRRKTGNEPQSLPVAIKCEDLFYGTLGCELATWDGHPPFNSEMFVAKLFGDTMNPMISPGTNALFFINLSPLRRNRGWQNHAS